MLWQIISLALFTQKPESVYSTFTPTASSFC